MLDIFFMVSCDGRLDLVTIITVLIFTDRDTGYKLDAIKLMDFLDASGGLGFGAIIIIA